MELLVDLKGQQYAVDIVRVAPMLLVSIEKDRALVESLYDDLALLQHKRDYLGEMPGETSVTTSEVRTSFSVGLALCRRRGID